jgi:hypothetical protein
MAAVSTFLTICAAGSRHANDYLTVWLWTAPWRGIYKGFPRSTRSSPMPLIGVIDWVNWGTDLVRPDKRSGPMGQDVEVVSST